jgi:hypothetical protein
MFRCNEVNIVYAANVLELNVPLGQLLRGQVEAVRLMAYVGVLTKGAFEAARREKDASGPIMALYTRLCHGSLAVIPRRPGFSSYPTFSKMRSNGIDFDCFRPGLTHSGLLIAIDPAETRTQVAVAEMCICLRAFLGRINR